MRILIKQYSNHIDRVYATVCSYTSDVFIMHCSLYLMDDLSIASISERTLYHAAQSSTGTGDERH